jgi:hypothetical protein
MHEKELRVPVKGDYVQWAPYLIIFTSNYHPSDWYPNAKDEHRRAMLRRFHVIKQVAESAFGPEWIVEKETDVEIINSHAISVVESD